jgi:hypothetical protein
VQGINIYKTKESFTVARLHYTADPDKCTPEAIAELEKGYPGGRLGAAWRKEMEIDFTAYSGQLLCYHILQQYRNKIIIDRPIEQYEHKYGSLDWGRRNAASFHIYTVKENKHIHSAYEIYKHDTSLPDFCNLIKSLPFYHDLIWISADPSLWNRNQETKEGLRSLANMFMDNGITLLKGKSRDDELAINELLDRWYQLDIKESAFTISPKCPMQIWEFERLRYKELTTAMIEKSNPEETLVDKDNHSWDDWKYFISTWITEAKFEQNIKPERGSVAEIMAEQELQANDWRAKYA